VLLQPHWLHHLRRVSALTRLYPARLFDQEVRHPLLCFALLWFGFVHKERRKEGVANHFFAFSQHTHHTIALHPG
jgi:hypothetical protein